MLQSGLKAVSKLFHQPEVQKLARHSEIKMTMPYAHIDFADQAKAVANFPASALHWRYISGVSDRLSVSVEAGRLPKENA